MESLSVKPAHRFHINHADAVDRISNRLWNRPRQYRMARHFTNAGYPAFLDQLFDPRLCVDGHFGHRRPAQPAVAGARIYRNPADHSEYQLGGIYRDCLYLLALHDPAHLRQFGKIRQFFARSGD